MLKKYDYNDVAVLLAEDDDIEAEGIRRAFKKMKIKNPIFRVKNGLEALELLRSDVISVPRVVLLDLNMPKMGGLEFLQAIRNDESISDTIIFVFTTSKSEKDMVAAYKKNIAGYIVKSDLDKSLLDLVELLKSYWRAVEMPTSFESSTR